MVQAELDVVGLYTESLEYRDEVGGHFLLQFGFPFGWKISGSIDNSRRGGIWTQIR